MNSSAANNAAAPAISPWLIAIVVSMATFMEVLDTTITNVSLSHISGSLAASPEEGTWVLTSYLIANGIILPLSGWLSDALGRKKFFLGCIAAFTGASFACGASTSLEMLIFFRIIQGLAGGGLQPTQQAIIIDIFPPEKRGAAFGITGITLIAAPIIGPTLGGWITDNFDWRWIFFINVPVGLLAFVLVSRLLRDAVHSIAKGVKSIDYIGLGLIIIGLGCMQLVLDKGQQKDWFGSDFIIFFASLSFFGIVSAIFWLLSRTDPIVDLRLLKERSFALPCVMIFFTGFVLYGSSALLPIMLQSYFGYDATLAGLVLSPGGFAVILLMPIAGKLVSKIQARYLVALGMSLCCYGMYRTTGLTPQSDYPTFVWMRVFQTLGLPFLFIPISTIAFMKIPRDKSNKASALFALSRNLGGSIGIALVATLVSRYSQIHQKYLSAHLVPGDTIYNAKIESMVNAAKQVGYTAHEGHAFAQFRIYAEMLKQSAIMAYADSFTFLMYLMAFGVALTFLLPKNNPRAKANPAAAAH